MESFDSIFDMLQDRYVSLLPNDKETVTCLIDNVTLNFHIYRLPDYTILDSAAKVSDIFTLCTSDDTYTQCIICDTIDIRPGIILTPPHRCKGLIIYANDAIINSGTISMTSRGAVANGQNLCLFIDLQLGPQIVPAQGGAGGSAYWCGSGGGFRTGYNGANGVNRQSGGGGSGGSRNWSRSVYIGRGGYGTSYSGGTGSASAQSDGGSGGNASSGAAPDNGGYSSNPQVSSGNSSGYAQIALAGQGNPTNTSAPAYRWGAYVTPYSDVYGTGGLLVLYCINLNNYGSIQTHGGNTLYTYSGTSNICISTGGASGGGSLNIFTSNTKNTGTITATGGQRFIGPNSYGGYAQGGLGGNGCVTITNIDEYNFFSMKRKNSNIYRDANYPSVFNFDKIPLFDNYIIKK